MQLDSTSLRIRIGRGRLTETYLQSLSIETHNVSIQRCYRVVDLIDALQCIRIHEIFKLRHAIVDYFEGV